MTEFKYVGGELDLFAGVLNWKAYWSKQISPFLGEHVLEVGAGIGSNTLVLESAGAGHWLCLEPDPGLFARLVKALEGTRGRYTYEPICGTIQLLKDQKFDTILYIDVLEHIDDDRAEIERVTERLRPNGHLIVLSPAHQWLFTPFDAAIGHYRRYNRSTLRRVAPAGLNLVLLRYIDSVGLLASAANLLVLRQSTPTVDQLAFWDRGLIPISRFLDPCCGYRIGKSIVAVWRKQ
jgi:SAM-dependent methyltransferase